MQSFFVEGEIGEKLLIVLLLYPLSLFCCLIRNCFCKYFAAGAKLELTEKDPLLSYQINNVGCTSPLILPFIRSTEYLFSINQPTLTSSPFFPYSLLVHFPHLLAFDHIHPARNTSFSAGG